MSKMADIALQLDEQAVEYGLQGYQEALEQGFAYEVAEDGTATLTPPSNGLEMAHEAWLKERERALHWLEKLSAHLKAHKTHDIFGGYLDYEVVDMGIKIIKEGEL